MHYDDLDPAKRRSQATSGYETELLSLTMEAFPPIDGTDMNLVEGFYRRDPLFIAFPLREGPLFPGLLAEILVKSIDFASEDKDDPAYSWHAFEHETAPEASRNMRELLRTNPALVTISRQPKYYVHGEMTTEEIRRGRQYRVNPDDTRDITVCESFVLRGPEELRFLDRPLFLEVGNQVRNKTNGNPKEIGKILRRFAGLDNVGVDFVVLVGIVAGLDAEGIVNAFKDSDLKGKPTYSRDDRAKINEVWKDLVLYDRTDNKRYLTFSKKRQEEAVKKVSEIKGLKKPLDGSVNLLKYRYREQRPARSTVVLGSLSYSMAHILGKDSKFRNPARQLFIDQFQGNATSRVVSMYNAYEDEDRTEFGNKGVFEQFVADLNGTIR